jgi:hypothetical protein
MEKQAISITLIDSDQQRYENEFRSSWCIGERFISTCIPIFTLIVIIILLILFRESNKRCEIFDNSNQCK